MRGRGLKRVVLLKQPAHQRSPPMRGRGLKRLLSAAVRVRPEVAPPCGGVD